MLRQAAGSLCVALLCAAQSPQPQTRIPDDSEILRSFEAHDYPRAAELIDQSLHRSPGDALMLYNAACARALLKEYDLAGQFLLKAVQAGFKDFSHMRRDPDLIGMREHPVYQALVDARDSADAMLAQREVDKWRKDHGDQFYRYEHDQARRLHFITSLDETEHAAMRDMLDREADHLAATLFESGPRRSIIIVTPTPADVAKLMPDRHVHGTYKHMKGMLIAADTGPSLRHEFFHALHHNHMDRVGQQHPLWIQEGLAALYEDYELNDKLSVTFLPNERRNVAKSMARDGRLLTLDAFISQTDDEFAARPALNYVQSRSVFEFLAERGVMQTWYEEYVRGFDRDSSGGAAMIAALGKPLHEIDKDWRQWLDGKPTIVTQDAVKRTSPDAGRSDLPVKP
jgi:hypothetical protein